ncbi:5-formyltetrahydrofolate cyclo-ligase [Afifella sp. IM 167]|uniref:5-formyltetrahydrofolate cyclo-ligase n=1 Tax=Afifella sp. IM 167 TaxID=2033586 RepID=UPI001CCC3E59|nr:5-formyltetrahydrofolate cyclo-ligase [Afifella sp. IM 167]MBZ8135379.1 5-formyltetrahydrofolate cyclo-ligase [Afifella sp. IM 167]
MPVSAAKAEIRKAALARRAALGEAERATRSARALRHLEPILKSGETVSLFWPIRDEIDPRRIFPVILARGGRLALPAIVEGRLVFRAFAGEAGLERGTFGTRHPDASSPEIAPDLIVAPLAAFDRAGGRLGYGRGYYDTVIARLMEAGHSPRLAGLAFACQEVEEVPMEAHDIRLSVIATEDGLIETPTQKAQA